ncbi:uncharacterized protein LOC143903146 isoform X2 [Temnothorax americanus]|uniref:uncharacterized protein LOC143903146 isoform X2 n=1 Tax=Temnothorax americanus TaxID=1964332 RepID=UPI0040676978
MNKDDPRYQQWLAQKSCTNYDRDKRSVETMSTLSVLSISHNTTSLQERSLPPQVERK